MNLNHTNTMSTAKKGLITVTALVIAAILTFVLYQHQTRRRALRSEGEAQKQQAAERATDLEQLLAKDIEFIAPAQQACKAAMLNVRRVALQRKDARGPLLKGPDAQNLELLYKEPIQGITELNPATLIVRQKTPVRLPSGKWARLYGVADGSVLTAKADDSNFEQWEADYTAKYLRKSGP